MEALLGDDVMRGVLRRYRASNNGKAVDSNMLVMAAAAFLNGVEALTALDLTREEVEQTKIAFRTRFGEEEAQKLTQTIKDGLRDPRAKPSLYSVVRTTCNGFRRHYQDIPDYSTEEMAEVAALAADMRTEIAGLTWVDIAWAFKANEMLKGYTDEE